jgi:hypothetical protein
MPTTLILDTNVFYNLGNGSLTPSSIARSGELICYSPISVLEIAGKWSLAEFNDRKAAAAAILASSAVELPDPDTFLTRDIFGYELRRPVVAFTDAVKAMADSRDVDALVLGVEDFTQKVIRKVSAPKVKIWRAIIEGKWVSDMRLIQRRDIPGFAAWESADPRTRKPQVPRLKSKAKSTFLKQTTERNWTLTIFAHCHHRALLGARRDQPALPALEAAAAIQRAITSLSCYCAVYTQYLIRLLTDGALPQENDSGDLELFLYAVDDDHIVVTSEKKWKRMADSAGFGQRVRLV